MNNLNIKLYFKKRKQRVSIFGVSPDFDWRFIQIVTSIIIVCGIVFAVYLYNNITSTNFFEGVSDPSSKNEIERKRSEIKKAVDSLEKRNFDETALN